MINCTMLKKFKRMQNKCVKVGGLHFQLSLCQKKNRPANKLNYFSLKTDLRLKLQKATEEHNTREYNSKERINNLSKERDELLYLSLERANFVQVRNVCSFP